MFQKGSKYRKYLRYFLTSLLLFDVYIILGRIGPSIATENLAAAVWLPSGFALVAILLLGYKYWPSIALGEFIVNWYLAPLPPDVSVLMAIGNTAETLFAVYILKHFGFNTAFSRLKDVLLLYLVAIFCTAISATFGVTSLYLGQIIQADSFIVTWKTWWIANTLSIIIIPPVILCAKEILNLKVTIRKVIELIIFAVLLLVIDLIIFHEILNNYIDNTSATYLIYPPLLWAALRFGVGGTAITILFVTILFIFETAGGLGPFSGSNLATRLLSLQTYIATFATTITILAITASERKALDAQKDEFLSIASHELRTPMTSIRAYSQIVSKLPLEKNFNRVKEYLKKLDYQINGMTDLVNSLLNLSKIEIGRFEMDKEVFCIDKLVYSIVEEMQLIHPTYTLIFKNNIKNNCLIFADKKYISQVIMNLIANAMKYSLGKNKIIIDLEKVNAKYIAIGIRDFGVGILEDDKAKIFGKYYRVSTKNDSTISGLGIGLYISDQIIKNHGGRISVVSEPNKGSTFTVILPVVQDKSAFQKAEMSN